VPKALMVLLDEALKHRHQMVVLALMLVPKAQLVLLVPKALLDEALRYRHQMVVLALLLVPKAQLVLHHLQEERLE